jgi:FixJ family two-component response regulator
MTETKPTVFVVDDDGAVRRALELLMKSVGHPCELYPSGEEFLRAYDPDRPGCLVLDVHMSGMSGIDLQERLVKMRAILPIIFVSGQGNIEMAVRTIHAGAVDFLPKPFKDQDLLDRIRECVEVDRKNRELFVEREELLARVRSLTAREKEVMDLLVDGAPNKVIAQDLGISERTVEIHRARVMRKTGADSLARLVRMVAKLVQ